MDYSAANRAEKGSYRPGGVDGEWRGRKLWSMASTTGRVGWGVLQELWECPMQSEALERLSPKSGFRKGNGRKPKRTF